ncbi:MAG TPA: alpha/beta fold hydrolase [Terrimicrobiaceae bacterium]|nr:alpha/beta fold hydrolase [Terrimicrobiaceae bacterium]
MLAFDEAGRPGGRPIVLVHGWCCHRGHMAGLRAHFSATDHVFAVDLPGHGQTALGDTPPRLNSFAASLCSFLAGRDLRQVVLVGHSMGGMVSVLAAAQEPDRIARVVNLDGPVPLTAPAHAVYRDLFERLDAEGFQSVIGRFIREVFFLSTERGPVSEAIVVDMLSRPEALALPLLRQFPTFDAESALRAGRAPLLFIGSSHPRFDEAGLVRVRPDAWVARVALSGHFVQVFALPQVTAMIERFLALPIEPV